MSIFCSSLTAKKATASEGGRYNGYGEIQKQKNGSEDPPLQRLPQKPSQRLDVEL
jgi:hypothetical protein